MVMVRQMRKVAGWEGKVRRQLTRSRCTTTAHTLRSSEFEGREMFVLSSLGLWEEAPTRIPAAWGPSLPPPEGFSTNGSICPSIIPALPFPCVGLGPFD